MTVLEILLGCFAIVGVFGVVAVGLAPRVSRRVFVHQLQRHADDVAAVDSDSSGAHRATAGPERVTVRLVTLRGDWNFAQTFTAPVLAILQARSSNDLERIRAYVVPSVFQWLRGQPAIFEGAYTVTSGMEATIGDYQMADCDISGNHVLEAWTLLRRRNPIVCLSCGATVIGAVNTTCKTCQSSCSGFEAGWRLLDITPLTRERQEKEKWGPGSGGLGTGTPRHSIGPAKDDESIAS